MQQKSWCMIAPPLLSHYRFNSHVPSWLPRPSLPGACEMDFCLPSPTFSALDRPQSRSARLLPLLVAPPPTPPASLGRVSVRMIYYPSVFRPSSPTKSRNIVSVSADVFHPLSQSRRADATPSGMKMNLEKQTTRFLKTRKANSTIWQIEEKIQNVLQLTAREAIRRAALVVQPLEETLVGGDSFPLIIFLICCSCAHCEILMRCFYYICDFHSVLSFVLSSWSVCALASEDALVSQRKGEQTNINKANVVKTQEAQKNQLNTFLRKKKCIRLDI